MAPSVVRSRWLVLVAALLFSTGGAAIKATTLSSWQVASFRSGIAALTVFVLMPAARRGWRRSTGAIGIAYAVTMILFVTANKLTTAGNTIFLQSTAPLYVLILGPWILAEPVRRRDVAFMIALAVGLGLFFLDVEPQFATAPRPMLGNVLAAVSGLFWAITLVGLRWAGRGDEPGGALPAVVAGNALACLICLPLALPVLSATAQDVALLLFLGIFQIGIAYVALTRGLAGIPALEASLLVLIEPVLNPLWAWWIHGETPGPWALLGGAVIVTATAVRSTRRAAVRDRRGRTA